MLRLYVCGTSGGGKTRLIKSLQRFDRSTRRVVDATFDDEDDPEERHQLQPGAAVEQWLAHQQAHMTIRLTQFSARAEDYLLDIALNNASLEHCAFLIVVRMPTVKWPSLDTVIRAIASAVRFHLNGLANRIKWHRLQRRPPHHCPSTCVVLSHASDVELTPLNIPLGPLHEQLIHLWQQLRAEYEEFVDLLEVPHRLDCRKHKQARAVFRWVRACYNAMPRREGALRRAAVRFFDSWQNSELRNFEKNGARPPPGWPARLFLRDVCVPFTQADRLILRHYAPADVDPAQFGIVATQVLSYVVEWNQE